MIYAKGQSVEKKSLRSNGGFPTKMVQHQLLPVCCIHIAVEVAVGPVTEVFLVNLSATFVPSQSNYLRTMQCN